MRHAVDSQRHVEHALLRALVVALVTTAVLRLWHHADLAGTCTERDNMFVHNSSTTSEQRQAWAVRAQIRPYMWSNWWVPLVQAGIVCLFANRKPHGTAALYLVTLIAVGLIGSWDLVRDTCTAANPCGKPQFALAANMCNYPADGVVGNAQDAVPTDCLVCDDVVRSIAILAGALGAISTVTIVFANL